MRADHGQWLPAIARYIYNVELARSLVPVLHASEVVLRNHLIGAISTAYPQALSSGVDEWGFPCLGSWLDVSPTTSAKWPILRLREREKIRDAKQELQHAHRRKSAAQRTFGTGHLIATLRFGFWTRLIDDDYANWRVKEHYLWQQDLHDLAFPLHPDQPGRRRKDAHGRFTEIKELRNRVFHHEHLRTFSLTTYDSVVEAIGWMNRSVAETLRTSDRPRIEGLMNGGPARQRAGVDAAIARLFPSFA